jgi:hypothetical protein
MADPVTSGGAVNPNTQESIDQINANMKNVLDFQNQTHQAISIWEARLSVSAKSWQLVDQAIQTLQR